MWIMMKLNGLVEGKSNHHRNPMCSFFVLTFFSIKLIGLRVNVPIIRVYDYSGGTQ